MISHTENGLQCEHCQKHFTLQTALTDHFKKKRCPTIHGTKPCTECSKSFFREGSLKKHLQLAHNFKSETQLSKCEICSKLFSSAEKLQNHMKNHMEKPCTECSKSYFQEGSLKKHLKLVHNIESEREFFNCTICSKVFLSAKILQNHMISHSQYALKCRNCQKVFGSKETLLKHLKRNICGALNDGNGQVSESQNK